MNKSFRSGIAKTTAMLITGLCGLAILLITLFLLGLASNFLRSGD